MFTILESRRGMALGMTLGALVIIGLLISGVVWAGTQDFRQAANTLRQTGAEATAELGVNRLLATWQTQYNVQMKTGDTLQRVYTTPGGGQATVLATRLPGAFFWITSEGQTGAQSSQASARRRYGVLWRLNTPEFNFPGAIVTQGKIQISGSVMVNGNDSTPAGWPGCTRGPSVAGADISPTTTATVSGSVKIYGSPPVVTDTAAADTATYFNYGNFNYQSLAAMANLTLASSTTLTGIGPVVINGVCATGVTTNWGDPGRASPSGACESYFPIIHALGNLTVTTGTGQGVLLVDGNLTTAGNFTFDGIVIVRGSLTATGTGNKFTGGVMAAGVSVSDNSLIAGNSGIQYSSCAINQTLLASAYPKQAIQRGWVDLY